MPLVGQVGRKRFRARFAMGVVYFLLILGAVTTVYPFLLMATTGFKGPTDQNDNKLMPVFWREDLELATKFWMDRYSGSQPMIDSARAALPSSADLDTYERFLMELPSDLWTAGYRTAPSQVTSRLSVRYQSWLRAKFPSIDALNKAYIDENVAFQTVTPPAENYDRLGWNPKPGPKWDDWLEFKKTLPAEYRIPIREERMYQDWMRSKVQGQFATIPEAIRGSATKFEELRLSTGGEMLAEFRAKGRPQRFESGRTVEELWSKVSPEPLPLREWEDRFLTQNANAIKQEFSTRNYRYVLDYIAINGRALWNTVIFCLLTILVQLIVNPVAAYALSRVPMPATGKVLIFLLATMAFPAEVAMIPSFLMLKDMGLLNTFWALVLPGAANGYMIYLLKGFFDSLPGEVFESGQLDGAKEATMMWKIAFPLSRPVLGYLALLAFMGAYGAFMFAFLVVQDRSMWTLMVFLYQLQNSAPKAVMMAALTLAALPTLLVFLACQRVIMRGIVLPGER